MQHAALLLMFTALALAGCKKNRPPAESNYKPPPDEPNPDLEYQKSYLKRLEQTQSNADRARAARSIALLKKEGVPVLESLPQIAVEAMSTRRTTKEVALRAMALAVVALRGAGLTQREAHEAVRRHDLHSALTARETLFLDENTPSKHDRTQFAWRYEAAWVLLWALGFVPKLRRPDAICDAKKLTSLIFGLGRDKLLAKSKLRQQREILDAADLIYRYHWAVRQARLGGKPAPAKLDKGVVKERHHALNWLIGYQGQSWDLVKTDT